MSGATIKGSVDVGGTTYEFSEFKSSNRGAGSRGIRLWVKGARDDKTYRKLDPNPHDVRRYNSKQTAFYEELAKKIGTDHAASGQWPDSRVSYRIECVSEDFALEEW